MLRLGPDPYQSTRNNGISKVSGERKRRVGMPTRKAFPTILVTRRATHPCNKLYMHMDMYMSMYMDMYVPHVARGLGLSD